MIAKVFLLLMLWRWVGRHPAALPLRSSRLISNRQCAQLRSPDSSADGGNSFHVSVMKSECLHHLNVKPGGLYMDCTLGGGGHTEAILQNGGRVIALDQDPNAISSSSTRLKQFIANGQLEIHSSNFRHAKHVWQSSGLAKEEPLDGVLMDLGVSSHQLDAADRGFSFMNDGPLDMRMHQSSESSSSASLTSGPGSSFSAASIVNEWTVDDLADVLYYYGEERRSRQFARDIVLSRPLRTTEELRQVIARKTSFQERQQVLARCFQALRIAVNDELFALEDALESFQDFVKPQGRLVVMSFHSLEDRRVKNLIKLGQAVGEGERWERSATIRQVNRRLVEPREASTPASRPWRAVEKRVLTASQPELEANSRARSAKLRVAERTERADRGRSRGSEMSADK